MVQQVDKSGALFFFLLPLQIWQRPANKTEIIDVSCVCVLGDKSVFFHQDPKACDPEGFHGQQSFRWEKPEAELWKPHRQQHHVGCKFIYLYGVIKSGTS